MENQVPLYDLIYALAACNGREAALFGSSAPQAHEAFEHSLVGSSFPELWFELPLAGDAWFDLHALASRSHVDLSKPLPPERCGGYPEVFAWFARQSSDARQLALSWDTGSGDATRPAIQLLVRTRDPQPTCDFLAVAGRGDLAEAYRTFVARLPQGWFACYTGVFPQRTEAGADDGAPASTRATRWAHVECIPNSRLQMAYASDADLLRAHLQQVGFTEIDEELVARCHQLAGMPFQLEFQIEVAPDATVGPTFGASLRFAQPPGSDTWRPFEPEGAAGRLMEQVEAWGLADSRWRLLADTAYAKRASWQGASRVLYCFPAFIKLRWRDGKPLDAKTYLMAGAQ